MVLGGSYILLESPRTTKTYKEPQKTTKRLYDSLYSRHSSQYHLVLLGTYWVPLGTPMVPLDTILVPLGTPSVPPPNPRSQVHLKVVFSSFSVYWVNSVPQNVNKRTNKGNTVTLISTADSKRSTVKHSPNLPYSKGIGSHAAAIPVLKVV